MKKTKTTVVVSGLLVGALVIGGAIAYLTDSDHKKNSIAFADNGVDIGVEEPGWSEPDGGILPNQIVTKDPQVVNNGEKSAFVYMTIKAPVENASVFDNESQTALETTDIELYKYFHTVDNADVAGFNADKWAQISKTIQTDSDGKKVVVYLFAYKTVLNAGDTTTPLFNKTQFANTVDKEFDADNYNIIVDSYALQADSVTDSTGAAVTNPEAAWDILAAQNEININANLDEVRETA